MRFQGKESNISDSNNALALELYAQLKTGKENLFISPLSIFIAISMVYVGARGTTEEEIRETLHITLPQEKLPMEIKNFTDRLLSMENIDLNIANSVWTDFKYDLMENYTRIIKKYYPGAFYKENFDNAPKLCDKINTWVKKKTKNKIQKIITPEALDPSIRLILLNAIYFNGTWKNEFKPSLTNEAPFYLLSRNSKPIPLMYQKNEFPYAEMKNLQILKLSYKGGLGYFNMTILLPKEKYGLEKIEDSLTLEDLKALERQLITQEVKIYIPRFKMETEYMLKKNFKIMGMKLPFLNEANFSGIVDPSTDYPPYIGEIIQKAFVEVNEKGTEAAAATLISMAPTAPPRRRVIPVFRADHPFLFMIQDIMTGCILFLGRVLNPTPAKAPRGVKSTNIPDSSVIRKKRQEYYQETRKKLHDLLKKSERKED
jgi:serpin B